MRKLTILIAAAGFYATVAMSAEQPALPPDFPETFETLAALIDQDELSGMDMARGSYLATRYFSVGRAGLPYLRSRFFGARTPGEASMSGLYMTIHGGKEYAEIIRRELESNRQKRVWLYGMVGTEDAFQSSLEEGAQWKPMLRVLPSTTGSRQLALSCLQSRDPLVRRAGLYWGYWLADAPYWKAVRRCSLEDSDAATQSMARHLLLREMV